MAVILQQILLGIIPILFSVTVHEVSHGYVAYIMGDDTAKREGRLTLNPLKHLDPIGVLVFIMTRIIGWAKPVPVNPDNLRNPKRDMIFVAAAGPLSNILLAVVFAAVFKFFINFDFRLSEYISFYLRYGFLPPLEGIYYKIMVPFMVMLAIGVIINIVLCIFNLIPILPLDGGRILYGILPSSIAEKYKLIEPFGIFIVIAIVFLGFFDRYLSGVIYKVSAFLLG